MADPRRPVDDEKDPPTRNSELEREERRLERLRLVVTERWPAAKPLVREADQADGSFVPHDPGPKQAA